jgi:transcriptional regulator with XRE-family HTH domain
MPPLPPDTLGGYLGTLRREKGFTLRQVGKALKVSAQSVHQWERDSNCPDPSRIKRLAALYEIEVQELLDRSMSLAQMAEHAEVFEARARVIVEGNHGKGEQQTDNPGSVFNHAKLVPLIELLETDFRPNMRDLRHLKSYTTWHVASDLLPRGSEPLDMRIVKIASNALEPEFPRGGYCIFDINQRELQFPRALYMASIDRLTLLMRYINYVEDSDPADPECRLSAPNPHVPVRVVKKSSLTILGLMVGYAAGWRVNYRSPDTT